MRVPEAGVIGFREEKKASKATEQYGCNDSMRMNIVWMNFKRSKSNSLIFVCKDDNTNSLIAITFPSEQCFSFHHGNLFI